MDYTRREFLEMALAACMAVGVSRFYFAPERKKRTIMGIRIMMAGDFVPAKENPVFEKTFMSFTAELVNRPSPPPVTDSGLEFCNYMYNTYGVPEGLPAGQFTSLFMYQIFDNGIIP